jgi:hypothetical protein
MEEKLRERVASLEKELACTTIRLMVEKALRKKTEHMLDVALDHYSVPFWSCSYKKCKALPAFETHDQHAVCADHLFTEYPIGACVTCEKACARFAVKPIAPSQSRSHYTHHIGSFISKGCADIVVSQVAEQLTCAGIPQADAIYATHAAKKALMEENIIYDSDEEDGDPSGSADAQGDYATTQAEEEPKKKRKVGHVY